MFSKSTYFKQISILFLFFILGNTGTGQENDSKRINFYENKNQWPSHVLYSANLDAGNIWLEKGRVLYHFMDYSSLEHHHAQIAEPTESTAIPQALISATFVGANREAQIKTNYKTKDYQNYFIGNNPEKWGKGIFGYKEVKYQSIYEGIDLLFFEKEGALKYEFHVSPFANPNQILIQYTGYSEIKITSNGNLVVKTEIGELIEQKPYVYQIINEEKVEVLSEYALDEDKVSFSLGTYNPAYDLILDPELIFATYSGAVTDNFGSTATYGYDETGYIAGSVFGNDYPTPQPAWNTTPTLTEASTVISDVFISKYSADGTTMLWTNFIGGGDNTQGTEIVTSIICDTANNVYLLGATSSLDFPILGGFQDSHAGGDSLKFINANIFMTEEGSDIFVSKISADGLSLMGSTYIGGSSNDGLNYNIYGEDYITAAKHDSLTSNYSDQNKGEIMLDSLNNILIASSTWSTDFPVIDGFQMTNAGMQDAVIFKISNDCSELLWSSYYGGTNNDAGYSVKVDTNNIVFLAGGTSSSDLSETTGSIQESYAGGSADGFIAKISENGTILHQSTYLGTTEYDQIFHIAIDKNNKIYAIGQTLGEIPITEDTYANEGATTFLWKMDEFFNTTQFSTLIGQNSSDLIFKPTSFYVDQCENIYVAGWGGQMLTPVTMYDMPTTEDAYMSDSPNGYDFYMLVLYPNADSLRYGSYIGGANAKEHAEGNTSRFNEEGILYQAVCGGCGGYSDFPTSVGAWSTENLSVGCSSLLYTFDFRKYENVTIETDDVETEDLVCLLEDDIILVGEPSGGVFSGLGVSGSVFSPSVAGEGTHLIYYSSTQVAYTCPSSSDSLVIIDSLIITVVDCLGIDENFSDLIIVFPNPFTDFTTLSFGTVLKEKHTIIIHDILGKEVYKNENISGSSFEIKKQHLRNGVYILSLYSPAMEKIYSTKLLIE